MQSPDSTSTLVVICYLCCGEPRPDCPRCAGTGAEPPVSAYADEGPWNDVLFGPDREWYAELAAEARDDQLAPVLALPRCRPQVPRLRLPDDRARSCRGLRYGSRSEHLEAGGMSGCKFPQHHSSAKSGGPPAALVLLAAVAVALAWLYQHRAPIEHAAEIIAVVTAVVVVLVDRRPGRLPARPGPASAPRGLGSAPLASPDP